jgi:hypothetical protein
LFVWVRDRHAGIVNSANFHFQNHFYNLTTHFSHYNEKCQRVSFQNKWELECGVKISSRNYSIGDVENFFCLFCRALEKRIPRTRTQGKGKESLNVQHFCAPWRIDKLKKHNKAMHPGKWAEYVACSTEAKKLF